MHPYPYMTFAIFTHTLIRSLPRAWACNFYRAVARTLARHAIYPYKSRAAVVSRTWSTPLPAPEPAVVLLLWGALYLCVRLPSFDPLRRRATFPRHFHYPEGGGHFPVRGRKWYKHGAHICKRPCFHCSVFSLLCCFSTPLLAADIAKSPKVGGISVHVA